MKSYQVRDTTEITGGVTMEVVYDALTPQPFADYASLDAAIAATPEMVWTTLTDDDYADGEISGDILATAPDPSA